MTNIAGNEKSGMESNKEELKNPYGFSELTTEKLLSSIISFFIF